jgi:hypothetical protein
MYYKGKNKVRYTTLGRISEEFKSIYKGDPCTPMFTVALFTIAKVWNQPRGPSTDEQIKKL